MLALEFPDDQGRMNELPTTLEIRMSEFCIEARRYFDSFGNDKLTWVTLDDFITALNAKFQADFSVCALKICNIIARYQAPTAHEGLAIMEGSSHIFIARLPVECDEVYVNENEEERKPNNVRVKEVQRHLAEDIQK